MERAHTRNDEDETEAIEMTQEPFTKASVPDGAYFCEQIVHRIERQEVKAHAIVHQGHVTVLAGASVACELTPSVLNESPGLAARRDHVRFRISATLVDDVVLDSMTEATRLVLGRNVGWKTASTLWHDTDGRPIAEVVNVCDDTSGNDLSIVIVPRIDHQLERPVREFLLSVDEDFVPPLSTRTSAQQSHFERRYHPKANVDPYLDSIREQRAVLAMCDDVVAGMLSWEERQWGVAYVSTVAVRRALRGNGIATTMYNAFEASTHCPVARVRTWSDNWGHLKLLRSRGYAETGRSDDDRGYGVGSVYFEKDLKAHNHEFIAS